MTPKSTNNLKHRENFLTKLHDHHNFQNETTLTTNGRFKSQFTLTLNHYNYTGKYKKVLKTKLQ